MPKVKASARFAIDADEQEKEKMTPTAVKKEAGGTGTGYVDLGAIIGQVIDVLPEDLVVEQSLNVRPWEGDGKREQERIEALARSIQEEGQLQDGGVFPVVSENGEIEYHLFMGTRRRNAIAWINANSGKSGDALTMRVRVFPPEEAKRIRRKSILENLQRKNFSPMDLALDIQTVRKENGWEGGKHTKLVAKYFGVSPALITQHEKLLSLPVDVQAKVAETGMASDPAQFLATEVRPEVQAQTLSRAEEIAQSEAKTKPKAGGKADAKADAKAGTKPKVEKRHVVQAARETGGLKETKPRAKSELIDFFQEIADSPAYGYSNSPVRMFADYFVNKFASGEVETDRGLWQKFDAMVMSEDGLYAGEGTPSKAEQAELDEEEARAKEQASKAKAKTKAKTKAAGKK